MNETNATPAAPALVLRDQRFEARETLGAWGLMKLAKSQTSGDEMEQLAGLHDFILSELMPEERERFETYMDAAEIGLDEISAALRDLVAAHATPPSRPTLTPVPNQPPRRVSLSKRTVETEPDDAR